MEQVTHTPVERNVLDMVGTVGIVILMVEDILMEEKNAPDTVSPKRAVMGIHMATSLQRVAMGILMATSPLLGIRMAARLALVMGQGMVLGWALDLGIHEWISRMKKRCKIVCPLEESVTM